MDYVQLLSCTISIHAPREGSDPGSVEYSMKWMHFYPRSPRGERQLGVVFGLVLCNISIHAPREGSDLSSGSRAYAVTVFLSTLPARGATLPRWCRVLWTLHFYPRSPRGERPPSWSRFFSLSIFLSTLPARGATGIRFRLGLNKIFLSTLPARGATWCWSPDCNWYQNFYPRSPRGERPEKVAVGEITLKFLSTLPARGATPSWSRFFSLSIFLSTLPARGATPRGCCVTVGVKFLSTLPARGATLFLQSA